MKLPLILVSLVFETTLLTLPLNDRGAGLGCWLQTDQGYGSRTLGAAEKQQSLSSCFVD